MHFVRGNEWGEAETALARFRLPINLYSFENKFWGGGNLPTSVLGSLKSCSTKQ